MTIVDQIKSLYPQITDADFLINITIKDTLDGNGPFIAKWEMPGLVQPSMDELAKATTISLPLTESTVVELVQKKLDDFAATRRYNSIMSACTYINSKVPQFQIEGAYCIDARDAHWAACYKILADVQAGVRDVPTIEEVLKEMPELIWPT